MAKCAHCDKKAALICVDHFQFFLDGALQDKNYTIDKVLPAMRKALRALRGKGDASEAAVALLDAMETAKFMRCPKKPARSKK